MNQRTNKFPAFVILIWGIAILAAVITLVWWANVQGNCEGVVVKNFFGFPECVAAGELR